MTHTSWSFSEDEINQADRPEVLEVVNALNRICDELRRLNDHLDAVSPSRNVK